MRLQVIDAECAHCNVFALKNRLLLRRTMLRKLLIRKKKQRFTLCVLFVCSGNVRRTYEAFGSCSGFVRHGARLAISLPILRNSVRVAVNSRTAASSSW